VTNQPSPNAERILEALRLSSRPLDDDQLSARAGVAPRQTVNQTCRRLEQQGLLRRMPGPDGKIVNSFTSHDVPAQSRSSVKAAGPVGRHALPAGASVEQRGAERHMLDALGERLGVWLEPRRLAHPSGARVELDGADADLTVLVECWAHQGPAKVAQKYKLMNDALKLHWIATTLPRQPRLVLCVSDEAALRHLAGRSWHGQALRDLGVELEVVSLPDPVRDAVVAAQKRQFR
jgi:hypothetical protein